MLYYLGKTKQPQPDGLVDDTELASLIEFYFVQILLPQKDLEVRLYREYRPQISN